MKKCGNPERLILNEGIKERPILFSSEMVRAILDNRKTETRRVMRPQPSDAVHWDKFGYSCLTPLKHIEGRGFLFDESDDRLQIEFFKIPYGVKGDRLYVRETFLFDEVGGAYTPGCPRGVIYKANAELWENFDFMGCHWKPSIHMPKKFSRIKLEIKEIRVERVQDIKAIDCECEGLLYNNSLAPYRSISLDPRETDIRKRFSTLWDYLNKKRGFGWEKNSFVWVIKFQRI